jgi:hypothetical protein
MANPPQGNDPPAAPLVDVGGGVFVPEFQTSGDVSLEPSGSGSSAETTAPTPTPEEIIAATQAAMAVSPDVSSYTVNGETVIRRSIDDQLKLLKAMEARQRRAQGLQRTRAYFRC